MTQEDGADVPSCRNSGRKPKADLEVREGDGENAPENQFQTHEQQGDQ